MDSRGRVGPNPCLPCRAQHGRAFRRARAPVFGMRDSTPLGGPGSRPPPGPPPGPGAGPPGFHHCICLRIRDFCPVAALPGFGDARPGRFGRRLSGRIPGTILTFNTDNRSDRSPERSSGAGPEGIWGTILFAFCPAILRIAAAKRFPNCRTMPWKAAGELLWEPFPGVLRSLQNQECLVSIQSQNVRKRHFTQPNHSQELGESCPRITVRLAALRGPV